MTCAGCKFHKIRRGYKPVCARFQTVDPQTRCLDFRHKQGRRVKS